MLPKIENPLYIELPPEAEAVLQKMFIGYQRVVIKHDFSELDFSGSWVIRVHPHSSVPELPVVVKISSASLIEKEWQAYKKYVQNKWSGIAELRGELVFHDYLAGLSYPLMGDGVLDVKSLRQYCLEASVDDVRFVLAERLFRIMKRRILRPSKLKFDFPLRASYDVALPVNLLIEPRSLSAEVWPTLITPDKLPGEPLEPNDPVRIAEFIITKVDLRHKTITLNLPPSRGKGYRWRLRITEALEDDRSLRLGVGEVMPPLEGVVLESRRSRLNDELKKVFGFEEPPGESVTLPDGRELPNPLQAIPAILAEIRDLKFNHIHGDLNLENVLVHPEVRDVRLIDFAESREDHVLHDFLRLETEIITKVLPVALAEANLPPEVIYPFYELLHCATFHLGHSEAHELFHEALEKPFAILAEIRKAARDAVYEPNDFKEYYQGLTLYLVGALRFRSLDRSPLAPLPKAVAFWGAAAIQQVMNSSGCDEPSGVAVKVPLKSAPERTVEERFGWLKQKSRMLLLRAAIVLGLVLLTVRLSSPQIAVWYNNQGLENYLAGNLSSAKTKYGWAIWWDSDYAAPHYNLGLLYEDLLDFERARQEYRVAIEGGLVPAHSNLARLYIRDGNYSDAVFLLLRGLELTEHDEIRYVMLKNLGWARLGQERYAEAESHLRAAIRLKSDRAPAYCLLAQVREEQNKPNEALSEWNNCLSLADARNPDEDVWIAMARKRLNAQGDE
ncbi:MAG: hypothetical protein ACPGWR_01405 [Ardenticatenaceae bacterium]